MTRRKGFMSWSMHKPFHFIMFHCIRVSENNGFSKQAVFHSYACGRFLQKNPQYSSRNRRQNLKVDDQRYGDLSWSSYSNCTSRAWRVGVTESNSSFHTSPSTNKNSKLYWVERDLLKCRDVTPFLLLFSWIYTNKVVQFKANIHVHLDTVC